MKKSGVGGDDFEASVSNNENVQFIYLDACPDLAITLRSSM